MDERAETLDPRERRLNDVVCAYLEAVDAGWAPDPEGLLARYPDLSDDLQAFFVAQSHVAALAYPGPSSAQRRNREAGGGAANGPERVRENAHQAFGDYEKLELIKEGGMGAVFKAWQKRAKRFVALKKIRAGRFASAADVRRFRDEAENAANLDHPNIVPIYDVGEENGQPYFCMKLYEHGSLQQHLARFERDHLAAARLLAKVARAVHYAHQHGILHRDLKPANILLDAQEQPYVADFGLAKRLANVAPARPERLPAETVDRTPTNLEPPADVSTNATRPSELEDFSYLAPEQADDPAGKTRPITERATESFTREGTFVGTQGYAPPEHAGTTREGSSTAADVYSLGAILYKMLARKTLFAGANLAETVRKIRECAPESPRAVNPDVDVKLEAICMKCLKKDPQQRYASAEALADDLERYVRGEPPLAWPLPWRSRAWMAARPYLLASVTATALSLVAATFFFVYYYFDPERPPRALEARAKVERLVLVGDTGLPAWSRWNVGEGTAGISTESEKPLAITTLDEGRLELLRKAPTPSFRFSAEVRHDLAYRQSQVGIYFGQHAIAADDGMRRYWCDLVFSDLGTWARSTGGVKEQPAKQEKYGKVFLTLDRYAVPRGSTHRITEVSQYFESAAGANKESTWRRLVVEVTPKHVQTSWEGQALKQLDRGELRKLAQPLMAGNEVVVPEFEFDPAGGIGLYVHSGRASFRRVVIEPLE